MARDILGEYGPDRRIRSTPGGQVDGGFDMDDTRDVMGYRQPSGGPSKINAQRGPGLHGDNCGNEGYQNSGYERKESSGSPGLGGKIRPSGSQGRR